MTRYQVLVDLETETPSVFQTDIEATLPISSGYKILGSRIVSFDDGDIHHSPDRTPQWWIDQCLTHYDRIGDFVTWACHRNRRANDCKDLRDMINALAQNRMDGRDTVDRAILLTMIRVCEGSIRDTSDPG